MSVPNQIIIEEFAYEPCDESHLYAKINLQAMQHAMQDLPSLNALKLWLYLSKNKIGYRHMDLSRADCVTWGMGKSQFTDTKQVLADKGYLVCIKGNLYRFVQNPEIGQEDGDQLEVLFPDSEQNTKSPDSGQVMKSPETGKNAIAQSPESGNNSTISGLPSPEIVEEILQYNIYNNNIDNIMECTSCSLEYAMTELGCEVLGQKEDWVVVKTRTGREIKFRKKSGE